MVAAAGNPLLVGLFAEFAPTLCDALLDMLDLVPVRDRDPNTGDGTHAALVDAVAAGDAPGATAVLRRELEETLALLRTGEGRAAPE